MAKGLKINGSAPVVHDWRKLLSDSAVLDYVPYPTGVVKTSPDEDGKMVSKMETHEVSCFGFQIEPAGRGKGIAWIPTDELDSVIETLAHYAENGVDRQVADETWLSPADAIHETIARMPRLDGNGEPVENLYDISFRVRMGKGSKSVRIPEEDFAEFVGTLKGTTAAIPAALTQLNQKREAAAAKAAQKK